MYPLRSVQKIVGNTASKISVIKEVREKLVALQRQLAAKENVVMDGRDIGTQVLPDATVKIYLTASATDACEKTLSGTAGKRRCPVTLKRSKRRSSRRDDRDMQP